MVDAGSGVGQWQPTAVRLPANMKAAGIDPAKISTILISHFHPDHIFGLMEKGTNAPIYPNAELVVSATEYKWWTEPGRVEKLPEARKALGAAYSGGVPDLEELHARRARKGGGPRRLPGQCAGAHARPLGLPGRLRQSAADDLQRHGLRTGPARAASGVAGAYDQDGPLAVESRRKLIDRVIAEKMMICGAHFPFPGAGAFAKDGPGYAFTPSRLGRRALRASQKETPPCAMIDSQLHSHMRACVVRCRAQRTSRSLGASRALAVDTDSPDAPDLTSVRAKIKAKDFRPRSPSSTS